MISDRRNITNPPAWWAAFEAAADSAGLSLSEWVGEACRRAVPYPQRRKLSERPSVGPRLLADREQGQA